MSDAKAGFINTIPTAPSVESLVVRLNDMEGRLDERFDLNRESLIQMLRDSERVFAERVQTINILLMERDRRVEERFISKETAVKAALDAQVLHTQAQFAASDKAISKAEAAQGSYNQTHNDLARKMDEQYKSMVPRPEHTQQMLTHDNKFTEMKEAAIALRIEVTKEIQILREAHSKELQILREGRSKDVGESTGKVSQQALISWVVGLALAAIVIGGVIVDITLRMK